MGDLNNLANGNLPLTISLNRTLNNFNLTNTIRSFTLVTTVLIIIRYFPVREIYIQTSGFHHLLHHPPKIENAEHFRNYRYSGIHITLSLAHFKVRFH